MFPTVISPRVCVASKKIADKTYFMRSCLSVVFYLCRYRCCFTDTCIIISVMYVKIKLFLLIMQKYLIVFFPFPYLHLQQNISMPTNLQAIHHPPPTLSSTHRTIPFICLLICYVVYFPSICNGEQFGFMYEFNFLCFCFFVCLRKINVIIIIIKYYLEYFILNWLEKIN